MEALCGWKSSWSEMPAYLQPLFCLLFALHRQNQGICSLVGDFQLVLLLFAVFGNVCDTAVIQEQFHLGLLVLGTFVTLNKHRTGQQLHITS